MFSGKFRFRACYVSARCKDGVCSSHAWSQEASQPAVSMHTGHMLGHLLGWFANIFFGLVRHSTMCCSLLILTQTRLGARELRVWCQMARSEIYFVSNCSSNMSIVTSATIVASILILAIIKHTLVDKHSLSPSKLCNWYLYACSSCSLHFSCSPLHLIVFTCVPHT